MKNSFYPILGFLLMMTGFLLGNRSQIQIWQMIASSAVLSGLIWSLIQEKNRFQ